MDPNKNDPKQKARLADKHRAETPGREFEPPIRRVILESPGSGEPTRDQALWGAIRNRTAAASFHHFEKFVDRVFCSEQALVEDELFQRRGLHRGRLAECYHGLEAYNLLKACAEVFLGLQCGLKVLPPHGEDGSDFIPGEAGRDTELLTYDLLRDQLQSYLKPGTLPYLARILDTLKLPNVDSPLCYGVLKQDRCYPCLLGLIWSYWHEEGMLVQSLNAICLRFQNKRGPHSRDPLANLRLDPLRPLNTLLWGYIQDDFNRLTVARRAYEYDQEYGLRLVGKAVNDLQTVDSRSKFIEAFHNLLYVTSRFYKEADDTTVRADAFPVLNALKELHLILAQGAHNQFGDLTWTARVEMLIQKWLLARPEIREFLGRAIMIPYKESWMAHVDSMKLLQGWTDVSVSHFRDLGVYGEQILLSVRYADWIDVDNPASAHNWAIGWRPEIQSYIHSYRAVTGIDLSAQLTDSGAAGERYVQPAIHQMRRQGQRNGARNGYPVVRNGEPAPAYRFDPSMGQPLNPGMPNGA
jgi:hypothetical protein